MFEKILVAFDGSKTSEKALDTAVELAKKFNSVIHLVSVIVQSDFAALKDESRNVEEERFYQDLQEKAVNSENTEVKIKTSILYGRPADTILDYVEFEDCDLLVIGSRGLNATERLFLGSVSDELSHHSSCPILIVRL